jgi:hypothetical protein
MKGKSFLLWALVVVSLSGALYEGVLYWHGAAPAGNLLSLWQLFFIVLLVLWVDADSKDHSEIYRPYEYGYLVFLFWLPYLPFYLWRTRRVFGLAMLGGFIGLFYLGYLGQWIIYAAR